ncbi:MAG: hypothetical protein V3W18_13000 [candidate division Zixibacteria bacterium]
MRIENIRYVWLAIGLATIVLIAFSVMIHPWMLDDALISFRYAENIAAGNGAVFNVGEKVEGYTTFLWVILLAAGKWIGFDTVIFSKIMGLIFALGCLVLVGNSHKFIGAIDYKISIAAVLFLGTSGVFLPWGVSGMEVTLFTLLVLSGVLYYLRIGDSGNARGYIFLGFLCGLTALTRPEGLLIFGLISIDILLAKNKRIYFLYLILAFGALYLPYYIWRYDYYGYLFPNTFYAKVGWSIDQLIRGFRYLIIFAIPSMAILLPLIDPLAISLLFKNYSRLYILPLIAGVYTIYIILVGGDPMPASRFFAPIMPIICILSAMSVMLISGIRRAVFIVTVVVVYNFVLLDFSSIKPHIESDKAAECGKEVAIWLRGNASPNTLIATNTAGSIPYYSKFRAIDMLGLNDIHIAHRKIPDMGSGWAGHEKGDGEYVLSLRPDLIQFGGCYGAKIPVFPSDIEIYAIPQFHEDYGLKEITMPSGHILRIFDSRNNPALSSVEFEPDSSRIESRSGRSKSQPE